MERPTDCWGARIVPRVRTGTAGGLILGGLLHFFELFTVLVNSVAASSVSDVIVVNFALDLKLFSPSVMSHPVESCLELLHVNEETGSSFPYGAPLLESLRLIPSGVLRKLSVLLST